LISTGFHDYQKLIFKKLYSQHHLVIYLGACFPRLETGLIS
jgi:hypothetical protein